MKTKKTVSIFIGIVLVIFISLQMHYRYEHKGNLVFYITNESLVDSALLEIYIDGNKVLEDKLPNQGLYLHKPYPIERSMGYHKVVIKINGEVSKEIRFNTFLVTFIDVEYYGNRFDIEHNGKGEHFNISIKKYPICFIA